MSTRSTKNFAKRVADKQRRLPEEGHTSGSFEEFVRLLAKAQRALFEVLLFVLFATTAYRLLDVELHLTERLYALAALIAFYLGR